MAKPFYKNLTFQVLTAIAIGALIGAIKPKWGEALDPLAKGFIRLITMVVGPIIFLTIVCGIAKMGDLKKVGRVGGKALLYFEIVTTMALAIGLVVANVIRPGSGYPATAFTPPVVQNAAHPGRPPAGAPAAPSIAPLAAPSIIANAAAPRPGAIAAPASQPAARPIANSAADKVQEYVATAQKRSVSSFLMEVIPESIIGAFAKGDALQILFVAVIVGVAMSRLGMQQSVLMKCLEQLMEIMFDIVAIIMKVAPLGALGAIAVVVGKFGLSSLAPLLKLMGCVYLTMVLFLFIVLASICRSFGFSFWKYLKFVREEIVLVLGTSSSETALPFMMEKLEQMGCPRNIVGMVIPAGYSFNLDGTSIYLSMAVLFIAQVSHIRMSFGDQIYVMAILMLTSKGAAAVTGGGFVTLAATLSATHILPVEGLALLLGVDRFMSEARAITNLIGNGVATIVVSKLEGEFDAARFRAVTAPSADNESIVSNPLPSRPT